MAATYRLSQQWDPLMIQAAQAHGINPNLLRGVLWQESNFDPTQTGPQTYIGTAKGIAQLTPDTQAEMGVQNPYDPRQAIPAAAQYLAKYRQVAVDRGYENPDAYAAMVYYGGPGFKVGNRPAAGVPGPDVGGYARSVIDHANAFGALGPGTMSPAAPAPGPDGAVAPGGGVPAAQRWSVSRWPIPPLPGPDGAVAPGGGAPAARWSVSPEVMNYPGVARGTALDRVDPRLVDIATRASGYLPDGWRRNDLRLARRAGRIAPRYRPGARCEALRPERQRPRQYGARSHVPRLRSLHAECAEIAAAILPRARRAPLVGRLFQPEREEPGRSDASLARRAGPGRRLAAGALSAVSRCVRSRRSVLAEDGQYRQFSIAGGRRQCRRGGPSVRGRCGRDEPARRPLAGAGGGAAGRRRSAGVAADERAIADQLGRCAGRAGLDALRTALDVHRELARGTGAVERGLDPAGLRGGGPRARRRWYCGSSTRHPGDAYALAGGRRHAAGRAGAAAGRHATDRNCRYSGFAGLALGTVGAGAARCLPSAGRSEPQRADSHSAAAGAIGHRPAGGARARHDEPGRSRLWARCDAAANAGAGAAGRDAALSQRRAGRQDGSRGRVRHPDQRGRQPDRRGSGRAERPIDRAAAATARGTVRCQNRARRPQTRPPAYRRSPAVP